MKTIGILGGLGPEATQLLFQKIIQLTPAQCDQNHIPIIIFNNPKIPDRTKAILYNGTNPLPSLTYTAQTLEKSGADFIIIPCNTAHYFVDGLQKEISVPIVNMIRETVNSVKKKFPNTTKIGLLATSGTVATEIYHKEFAKEGIEIICPDKEIQEKVVMESIYGLEGIKAGFHEEPKRRLENVADGLIREGAELVVAGCTEISIVLKNENVPFTVIDPLTTLAEKAVEYALIRGKNNKLSTEFALNHQQILEVFEEEE